MSIAPGSLRLELRQGCNDERDVVATLSAGTTEAVERTDGDVRPLGLDNAANPRAMRGAIWHVSAPRDVRKAFAAGRRSRGWKAWRQYLRTRTPTAAQCQCEHWRRLSADTGGPMDAETAAALRRWLDDAETAEFRIDYATSALTLCRRLPRMAAELPSADWWRLIDHLLRAAVEAGEAGVIDEMSTDRALAHQMLAGELALTLACLFPEIIPCRELLPRARESLATGLNTLLGRKGLLHANRLDRLDLFLACWTRCYGIGSRLNHGCFGRQGEKRYRRFVCNAFRLARRDGSYAFAAQSDGRAQAKLLEEAAALAGVARTLASGQRRQFTRRRRRWP